jgi:hypothetical protein
MESTAGLSVTGIVDEAGELHFIRSDATQYVGTATTAGNAISASFLGYAPFGFQFADGIDTRHGDALRHRNAAHIKIQYDAVPDRKRPDPAH